MFYLTIVIPCYNEESRITRTFRAYFECVSKQSFFRDKKIAIVFVNDGSHDKTGELITSFEKYSQENICIKAVSYEENQGKGAAIQRGCEAVDAEIYGFTDADLSYSPELVEKTLPYLTEYDMVIGERRHDKTSSGYSKIRNIFSMIFQKIINLILCMPNMDTQCGFKFFKNSVAKNILPYIEQKRFSFDIELILLALQKNIKIKSLPVDFLHQSASSVTWKDGIRYILDVVSISERLKTVQEKKFFLRLFAVSMVISFAVYGWVIIKGFFFSDDFTWLWHGYKIHNDIGNILTFRMSTFYSPVLNAFYSSMYSIFGYVAWPFFVIDIFIHGVVSFHCGVLAWKMSKSQLIAVTVTCLAAFAGGAYEPLVWIGANMHSFVTLFVVSCLIFYTYYLSSKKYRYLLLSFIFFVLAFGTKESAIVTPVLLVLMSLYYKFEYKNFTFSRAMIFFWTAIMAIFGAYAYQQYLWQKSSVWIQSGIWNITPSAFLRIPIILLDNFIPISLFKSHITMASAGFLWLVAIVFIIFVLVKFRKLKLVWLGFLWMIVSIAPVLFFKTEFWWEPLASRYNYLPRVGMLIVIAAILHHLIVHNKSRAIISSLIYIVVIATGTQVYGMIRAVTTEYDYVYATGKTLVRAIEEIRDNHSQKIIVQWDHPFTANTAHIVGATKIIANIDEKNITFLKKDEKGDGGEDGALLYWDPERRAYGIKK